jgi:predicted O-methyltransferase YrrM
MVGVLLRAFVPKALRPVIRQARNSLTAKASGLTAKVTRWAYRPNIYRAKSQERLGIIYTAPTHLSTPERLVLYAIVRGTLSRRALEIGTNLGGSAAIMAAAMEDNGIGQIVGLDPVRHVDPTLPHYYGRFKLIERPAPEGIGEAAEAAGGSFDLIFYDGPNVYTEVSRILKEAIPHLAEPAYIIVDNGFHYGVHQAVDEIIQTQTRFHDCGFLCVKLGTHDRHVAYNGLRLLRFDSNKLADPQPFIEREYLSIGVVPPKFDPEVVDHDGYWCRAVRKCPKCAREDPHRPTN